MPLTEDAILEQLKSVKYPGFSRDIISFGLVKGVAIDGGRVGVRIAVTTADPAVPTKLRQETIAAVKALAGVNAVDVNIETVEPTRSAMQATGNMALRSAIDGVRHVMAIASGKGGVGKSTVAANLAAAFSLEGARTGLCDCDIYGPSIALMFGTDKRPFASEDQQKIYPIERYGIHLMSMGFLLTDATPAILRGPMVTRYTQQFLRSVEWNHEGNVDVLVLDLPPGTGDIQLTIVQTVALSGAILVTTPQEVALIDARKAATMFHKVDVEVLGLIENMSYFLCPNDQNRYDIFGSGGGLRESQRLNCPLLAQIPLEIRIRESGDQGKPLVLADPESLTAQAFRNVAKSLLTKLLTK
jgi:ATP-binding protein involved in chromosome partitioning